MKKSSIVFALAAFLAVLISLVGQAVPLEQKLIRIHATERLGEFEGIEQEPIELQAALADMASDPLLVLRAKAALLRYRAMSLELLPMYASEPEFQDVFKRYGESVLPAIHYFVSNPVGSIELMNKAGMQYEEIKAWLGLDKNSSTGQELPPTSQQALTPSERGWHAIQYIQTEGHDFIGQFVVNPHGIVEWLASERVLEGITQFFGSGVRQLETRYKMDEEVSTSDIGWATLDVLVFASAVKVLRVGRTVATGTQTASRGTRSAALTARAIGGGRLVLSSARYAKWPLFLGSAYLVVRHPSLINDFLAELAVVIGLPPLLIQFVGWTILLLPILFLLRSFIWFLKPFVKTALWTASLMLARLSGGKDHQT